MILRGPDKTRTSRARNLRKAENDAEAILWNALRNRRLAGFKFVRQFPIGPYFADFACREAKLIVEADGGQHSRDGVDDNRNRFMQQEDWSVLRFWNFSVFRERESVLTTIRMACENRLQETNAFDLTFLPAFEKREPL